MTRRGFAPIFIILIAAAIVLGGGVLYYAKVLKKPVQVACTMEAKQCPDGSYVGRTGPNCEFTECPASAPAQPVMGTTATDTSTRQIPNPSVGSSQTSTTISTSTWKLYRNTKYGFKFLYPPQTTPFVSIDAANKTWVLATTTSEVVNVGFRVAESERDGLAGQGAILKIEAVQLDEPISTWLDDNLANYVTDPKSILRKDTVVAGKRAVEVVISQSDAGAKVSKLYVVQPGNYLLVITETAPGTSLDAVFSTLSFTP